MHQVKRVSVTPKENIRVGICDDDAEFVQTISALLDTTHGFEVGWAITSGAQVLEPRRWQKVDLILLDVKMSPMDGLQVARAMTLQASLPKILFLSAHDEKPSIRSAIQTRAGGFLLKETSGEGILLAIRAVCAGLHVFSPTPIDRLAVPVAAQPPENLPDLTAREKDVLVHVCLGRSNRSIAHQLHLAESTVKGIVSNLFTKLGASSRTQMIAHAHAWGLDIGPDPSAP